MKTRAPLSLLIISLFASATLQGCGAGKVRMGTPQRPAAVPAPVTAPVAVPAPAPVMQAPVIRPAAPVFQGPKSVVAVFDIQDTRKSRRLTPEQNADLTAYLTTLLTNTTRYATVPKSDLKAALAAEKAQSYDACYDESCQIDIGKEVAAEKSLATRLSKFGQKCIVAFTLYDLRKSAAENAVQDRVACDQDSLISAFERLVPRLASAQANTPAAPIQESEGTMF